MRVKTCPKFQVRPWVIDVCSEVVLAVLRRASGAALKEKAQMACVSVFTSTFKASQSENLNMTPPK